MEDLRVLDVVDLRALGVADMKALDVADMRALDVADMRTPDDVVDQRDITCKKLHKYPGGKSPKLKPNLSTKSLQRLKTCCDLTVVIILLLLFFSNKSLQLQLTKAHYPAC